MRMELEQRVTRLEERTVAVERDIKEIKSQLNETAKKSDVERLEEKLKENREELALLKAKAEQGSTEG
jgi:uncharacterized coiled-coil protein SlyX